MIILLLLIFAALFAVAVGFVFWPLRRRPGRTLLGVALAALVLGVGGGSYVMLGQPVLAMRTLTGPKSTDVASLVSALAWKMRQSPEDPRGWLLLGRGYLGLGDARDGAAAYRRAIATAPPSVRPALTDAYGEALTMSAGGAVPPDAEAAFRQVLESDPRDPMARFYIGQAMAERRDTVHAMEEWQGLLADTPAGAPWREALLERLSLLRSMSGGAPDIGAMVQGLAERLHQQPDDPNGWRRLIHSYVVLGQPEKAKSALADARRAMAGRKNELSALDAEAKELKLGG
jgi:cytochrome c-type biogenesis protein CcmH